MAKSNDRTIAEHLATTPFVVIIEAPGKSSIFQGLFDQIGLSPTAVLATNGRLLDLPAADMGVQPNPPYDAAWVPIQPAFYDGFRRRIAGSAAHIALLATDDDGEGEMIAHQVVGCLPPGMRWLRLRIHSLNARSVVAALEDAKQRLDLDTLSSVMARRTFDRLISYHTTRQTDHAERHYGDVGRIISPFLSSALNEGLTRHVATRTLDGGWTAVLEMKQNAPETLLRALQGMPSSGVRESAGSPRVILPQPWDYFTAVDTLMLNHRKEPEAVSAALQSLYQAGRISYHRTDSRYWSAHTHQQMSGLAARLGQPTFSADTAHPQSRESSPDNQSAHEAIHPLHLPILYGASDQSLTLEERCMNSICEHVCRCEGGRGLLTQMGEPASDAAGQSWRSFRRVLVSSGCATLTFTRAFQKAPGLASAETVDPVFSSPDGPISPERIGSGAKELRYITLSSQQAVFRRLKQLGICRPSTITRHAQSLSRRYVNHQDSRGNKRALQAIAFVRNQLPELLSPTSAIKIREALDHSGASLVERISAALLVTGFKYGSGGAGSVGVSLPSDEGRSAPHTSEAPAPGNERALH